GRPGVDGQIPACDIPVVAQPRAQRLEKDRPLARSIDIQPMRYGARGCAYETERTAIVASATRSCRRVIMRWCEGPRRSASTAVRRSAEDALVPPVLVRRVHEPLHDLGVRARRNLARGRQDESRVLGGRVDAAPDLG